MKKPSNPAMLLAGSFVLAGEAVMFAFTLNLGFYDPSIMWKLFAASGGAYLIFAIKRTMLILYELLKE